MVNQKHKGNSRNNNYGLPPIDSKRSGRQKKSTYTV